MISFAICDKEKTTFLCNLDFTIILIDRLYLCANSQILYTSTSVNNFTHKGTIKAK